MEYSRFKNNLKKIKFKRTPLEKVIWKIKIKLNLTYVLNLPMTNPDAYTVSSMCQKIAKA